MLDEIELLAEDIAGRGVKNVFGISGSGASYSLIDQLESRGVNFHTVHFEGSAALMAGAQGRLSGKAGVAVSIKGPGLTNLLPGMAACKFEAFPLVSISEAYPAGTPPSKAHKKISHTDLVKAVTKGRYYLSPQRTNFSDLADKAQAEIPGPVHLDLAEGLNDALTQPESDGSSPLPQQDLAAAIKLIQSSQCPVMIAGTAAIRAALSAQLNDLNIPVFSTAAAKGVVNETLAHAAGVYTGVGLEMSLESKIIPKADCVVGLGLRHNEVLAVKNLPCPAVNIDSADAATYSGFGFRHIADAAPASIAEIFNVIGSKSWGVEDVQTLNRQLCDHMLRQDFLPAHVFTAIEKYFAGKVRLVLDTGYFCTIGEHIWRSCRPDWSLSSGQGRYMGIGLPVAIGAALMDRSVPTFVALGDGGIGMYIAEVKLAVRHNLPLIIVLMTDGYFGSVYTRGIKDNLTETPVKIASPSWLSALKGLGVDSVKIDDIAQVDEALSGWRCDSGPIFMEASFDFKRYQNMVLGIR